MSVLLEHVLKEFFEVERQVSLPRAFADNLRAVGNASYKHHSLGDLFSHEIRFVECSSQVVKDSLDGIHVLHLGLEDAVNFDLVGGGHSDRIPQTFRLLGVTFFRICLLCSHDLAERRCLSLKEGSVGTGPVKTVVAAISTAPIVLAFAVFRLTLLNGL